MSEAIAYPLIEPLLVKHLEPILGVYVATKVPTPRPPMFVRVTRVGGTRKDIITDRPMVTFEAWADDEDDADALAVTLRAHVFALAGTEVRGEWIRRVVEVGGLQWFPDPISETPRYQFTAQIETRGRAL